jgi:hypothetical protein
VAHDQPVRRLFSPWFLEIQENLGDFPAATSKKEKNVVAANGGAKGYGG